MTAQFAPLKTETATEPNAPADVACPDCGETVINVQGLLDCPNCGH